MTGKILIGGTSHTGKSTLATALAQRLAVQALSTDTLGPHPGRPWPSQGRPVPPHVTRHYGMLPTPQLLISVLTHYQNLWPRIAQKISAAGSKGLILEGSALWPQTVHDAALENTTALWLTAGDAFLEQRIHCESGYADADPVGRLLIEKFVHRSLLFNQHMLASLDRLRLPVVDVEKATLDELVATAMRIASV